ncbi:hypothetical protein B4N89_37275 [Embleya scabrispora]|uniref:Uncharacterized protein n=1 Tax=Embleya scabrispora TaxID=159449 RepID=A0A1T3NMH8_9ACTN|nr:hypothetical protein [Embleya scabrispora]OPC77905.1 hypothetical protein B4N89_37275 [Embleya scabrispora]
MTYFVHVDVVPPSGHPPLDNLQRAGIARLLAEPLEHLDGVDGPDDMSIDLDDFRIGSHPEGALVLLELDAPALEFAETAAREVVEEILGNTEGLEEWAVASCEVKLHDALARKSLAAADGPDAPPADPAERARLHRRPVPDPHPNPGTPTAEEVETYCGRLRSLAPRLTRFPAGRFGHDTSNPLPHATVELAAGALVYAIDPLIDELFGDLVSLAEDEVADHVEDSDADFFILDELPPAFAEQYTELFVRRFIIAAAGVTQRLTSTTWHPPATTAEALALHLLLQEAIPVLDIHGLYDHDIKSAYAAFREALLGDLDPEWLYEEDPFDERNPVTDWFKTFGSDTRVHFYTLGD